MAYKFQVGGAILSGSLTQEGTVEINNDAGAIVGIFDNAGTLSASAGATAASLNCDGAVTAGSLVVGSADMSEADLEKLDGITNGTGAANKALVLNAASSIASGLAALTASEGIKANEFSTTGHFQGPAFIATGAGVISGSGQGSFNTLRLGGGTSTVSDTGVASFGGSVTAVGSFIIGSADLNETDMEKLDGITNGVGAANKALVLDAAQSVVDGLVALTASAGIKAEVLEAQDYIVIGSAELTEAELEMLDGISVGVGAANKALVLNADASIASGLASITASADVKASVFEATSEFRIGNARMAEAELEMLDGITAGTGAGSKALVLNADARVTAGLSGLTASAGVKAQEMSTTGNIVAGADVEVGGLFKMPTVTSGHILVADGTSFQEVALSGDATIASNGALTLANNSVSQAQLDDDAVGADELASNAVVNASVVDGALKADKLDIDGSTDIGADLADADLFIVDDGAGGTNRKATLTRMKKFIFSAISGDATATDAGQISISSDSNDVTLGTDTVILSSGYNYFTGSETAVCHLPSGTIGTVVTVKAGATAAGKTITINRSGSQDTIDGTLTSVVLESPYAAVSLVYVTHGDWRIV